MPHFPRKRFQLRHSKIYKKLENAFFKCSEHSFLSSKKLQNHFLRSFLWPNFDLITFEHFASLSQKMVSILSLKNFRETEWSFETLFPDFCKYLSDEVEIISKESEAKRSKLFKSNFSHRNLLRKCSWSYLELKNECHERLKKAFSSFLKIF